MAESEARNVRTHQSGGCGRLALTAAWGCNGLFGEVRGGGQSLV